MKKILIGTMLVLVLLSFVGCGGDDADYPHQEVMDEDLVAEYEYGETKEDIEDEHEENSSIGHYGEVEWPDITVTLKQEITSTSRWARNDTHFFFSTTSEGRRSFFTSDALYRLSFDDITQGSRVLLPEGEGEVEIVGISHSHLFISRREIIEWNNQNFVVYAICLETLVVDIIDSGVYLGVARFHEASNSILFGRGDAEGERFWIEALCLDTKERHVLFEFKNARIFTYRGPIWRQIEDGGVVFESGCWYVFGGAMRRVFIDAHLNAGAINYYQITEYVQQDLSAAKEFIAERRENFYRHYWKYAIVGDWLYYLHNRYDRWFSFDLYRVRFDGTENTLVAKDTDIARLLGANNMLFATVFAEHFEEPSDGTAWYYVAKLSEDGEVLKILGRGWHGHNSIFGTEKLYDTDFVMIMRYIYSIPDGRVQGLYCTRTGALFNLSTQ